MMKDLLVDLGDRLAHLRPLAGEWHGGQMSAFSGLASSGIVGDPDALLAEAEANLRLAETTGSYWDRAGLAEMAAIICDWRAVVIVTYGWLAMSE